jgi:hypothetical protein
VYTPGNAGSGTIVVPGKVDLSQLLLITNVTRNIIIYNFADTTYANTACTFTRANSTAFPTATSNSDGYTTITLAVSTNTHLSGDTLQIFYDNPIQQVRLANVGTDAFERTRVANPQSMLDADFEYGLQPTKWQVLDLMRNYPSVYEIPGTDTPVTSVTTDASTGTGGSGASLITVTTVSAHGFSTGTPVTIKGYLNTISGFSRAEGTFIINTVPTTTTFTYYAKAKVGTSNGDVLSTTYTQLRKGGFYTGSTIGTTTFTYTGAATPVITATFASPHGLIPADTILVNITSDNGVNSHSLAQGPYFVESVPTPTTLTYTARAPGTILVGSAGTLTSGSGFTNSLTITVFSTTGLTVGSQVTVSAGTGSFAANTTVTSVNVNGTQFTVNQFPTVGLSAATINYNPYLVQGTVYTRPDCFYVHRPFDGGVQLGTGGPAHGAQAIRQSKKYIRYQSGKAINYNTGLLMAPNYDLRSLTATGTAIGSTITVATDDVDHGLQAGAVVTITGVTTSGYNDTYTVNSIVDERQFTVLAKSVLADVNAAIGTPCLVSLVNWAGATVRAGTFDDQNGQFWQYDGQTVAVGYRSSTFQVAGTIAINADSNTVTGTNTRFLGQLSEGDRIVIKGMTHLVSSVTSDTQLYVTPDFRGSTNLTGVKCVKVKEFITPQNQWNIDRCDGTNSVYNPSGYGLLPNKMQMVGIQWTWYGAGFIDWMLRGPEGNYITVHRVKAANVNTEAYMRSGNQPVRYEVINEGPKTAITTQAASIDTTLTVADTTFFPSTGTLWADGEIVNYTGKTPTTFTGCTRASTFSQFAAGSTRTYSGGTAATMPVGTGVILINQTATPVVSHWGSAFMTDGGFDTDRGYIFNYQSTNVSVSTRKTTAFAIRLAPSVSNAIVGDLGVRELLNRAQLLLQGLEITAGGTTNSNSALVIEGVLNPQNYPTNVNNITWNTLQSFSYTYFAGGQPSFSQVAAGSSVTWEGAASLNINSGASLVITGASSSSTTITVSNYLTLKVGDYVSVTSGTGTFVALTTVTALNGSGTGFTVSVAPSQALSGATISVGPQSGATTMFLLSDPTVAGVRLGDDVTFTTTTGLSGNSRVTSVSSNSITLNNAIVTSLPYGSPVTFSRNTYALPGETIFSFVSNPSSKDSIDLSPLKELVNTPIGGRGTFPNGPDVLAINVYLTQGSPVLTNMVLRWGEAQA